MQVAPLTRRGMLAASAGAALAVSLRPACATPEEMSAAVVEMTGGKPMTAGRVKLDMPPLVENGNAAPLSVVVESPMTASDHVRRITVFNERNPQPHVIEAHLGPRSGRATLSTRIRLANTQRITAIAEMSDGTFWSGTADVIVTLAACVEGS